MDRIFPFEAQRAWAYLETGAQRARCHQGEVTGERGRDAQLADHARTWDYMLVVYRSDLRPLLAGSLSLHAQEPVVARSIGGLFHSSDRSSI